MHSDDRATSEREKWTATRAAVLEHMDAFNAHDTERLIAGLHRDVVWATGSDLYGGTARLREELFDDALWAMQPSLSRRTLVIEGDQAAGTFREALIVAEKRREFDIAVFFSVEDGLIRTVKVFREGSADIEP